MTAPTTRERRHQPLVIVNTGQGKGKTTAACGMALRAWAQGWRIGVFQFIKSGAWHVGEEKALRALGEQTGTVTWEHMGTGWSWIRPNQPGSPDAGWDVEAARAGWKRVKAALAAEDFDFYLLDEFTYPVARGWIDCDDVVAALRSRPGRQHVVITGRGCPATLLELADLATEMTLLKHPFAAGQRGQAGIEW